MQRFVASAAVLTLVFLIAPAGAAADPPIVSQPPDITVEATGPMTNVPYDVSPYVSDDDGSSPSISCGPTSFPVGTTAVSCTATNPTTGETTSFGFNVTVTDTTPPALNLSSTTAEATGPSGADVSYAASAVDLVDGSITPSCAPASGSSFPLGITTVDCSATDSHGNTATGSLTVTVVDTTPPAITVPSGLTVEATSFAGADVSYDASADDIVDGSVPVPCIPASGSSFAFGPTTVTCTATDSHGNSGSSSFTVTIVDTTPPTITVPAAIHVQAQVSSGIAVSYTASAFDIVDGPVAPSCSTASGLIFPVGNTTVDCTATDAHGNTAAASFVVSVSAPPPPPPPRPEPPSIEVGGSFSAAAGGPPGAAVNYTATASDSNGSVPVRCSPASGTVFPVGKTTVTCTATSDSGLSAAKTFTVTVIDRTPPPAVTGLKTRAIDGGFVLDWQNPRSSDLDHIELFRTRLPSGTPILLYRGNETTFTDRRALNPGSYRYTVYAVDASGNRDGVAIALRPTTTTLVRPADGVRVSSPPTLLWVPQGVIYYNVQLYRGRTNVLSVWPLVSHYALQRTWRFNGRRERLQPGTYRWYVWPGIGLRPKHVFGPLLGWSTFVVSG